MDQPEWCSIHQLSREGQCYVVVPQVREPRQSPNLDLQSITIVDLEGKVFFIRPSKVLGGQSQLYLTVEAEAPIR